MIQPKFIILSLLLGSIIFLFLAYKSLKKGRKEARRYRNRHSFSKNNRKHANRKSNHIPYQFSEQSILDAASYYNKKSNYIFAFDTDVLLEHPFVLSKIANQTHLDLFISQQVRYELDNLKDKSQDLDQKARITLKHISNLHKENRLEIAYFNKEFMKKQGFRPEVMDDRVICSYLEKLTGSRKIIFITNDNNARTSARTTKLIPLELDWNMKKKFKKRKEKEFRPGYFYKVLSIIFVSLAFGFFNGAIYMDDGKIYGDNFMTRMIDNISVEKAAKENQKGPTFLEDEKYPYLIESEYEHTYQGKKAGEWGAIAMVDKHFSEKHAFSSPNVSIVLGSWIDVEDEDDNMAEDKRNQLHYVLETQDGDIFEQRYLWIRTYKADKGIPFETIDSNITFQGVNHYENIRFDLNKEDTEKKLEKAKIRLEHKVTGEVITTIPLRIIEKEL